MKLLRTLQLFTSAFSSLFLLFSCSNKSETTSLSQQQDSVTIWVDEKLLQQQAVSYIDNFNERNDLVAGMNHIHIPLLLSSDGWRTQDILIKKPYSKFNLTLDSTTRLIRAASSNKKEEAELNFDFNYRKKNSIKDGQSFLSANFLDTVYIKNYQLRDRKITTAFANKDIYLRQYCKKMELDNAFLKEWLQIIKYDKLYRLTYFGNYEKWDRQYLTQLSTNLNEYRQDSLLYIPYYTNGCFGIANLLYYLKYGNSDKQLVKLYELISNNFTGRTKEFMLFKQLLLSHQKAAQYSFTKSEYDNLANAFYQSCQYKPYAEYLRNELNPANNILKEGEVLNMKNEAKPFAAIHNKQLTYVDFWASWCRPCIAEMPASKTLKEDYEKSGINFVYVSVDNNQNAWKKASLRVGLPEAKSYLLPNGAASAIAQKLKLLTIPRYIIIDGKGKIINPNAPRPSDPEIRQTFNQVLKEKLR